MQKKKKLFFTRYKNEWEEHKMWRQKKNKKSKFYRNKKVFKIYYIDVNKILFSKEEPYGSNKSIKYFIEYNDNDGIRPLCIMLLQMIGFVKCFKNNDVIIVEMKVILIKNNVFLRLLIISY